jgi:hypothetical protein
MPLLRCILFLLAGLSVTIRSSRAAEPSGAGGDFSKISALIAEHCLDCHAAQDPEGKLVMETYESLMKGGESGPVIVPGKSSDSLLVKMVEGSLQKDGKTIIMPPGKRKKLENAQIALIKAWIDGGASGPDPKAVIAKELIIPRIASRVARRNPINAAAYEPLSKTLALARFSAVELHSVESQEMTRKLEGLAGNINAVAFSQDGKFLYAGGGDSGLEGTVKQWNLAEGNLVQTYQAHKDAVYSIALSPDGKILASGSYDQKIRLWNTETGQEIRVLSGHNGCIYGLAFRADGKILASASGDRTVKLWDVASGERRDTLSQSLKDLYTVEFSPDGKRLAAGGADNRIRVWEISPEAKETTNPLLFSKFAHEGAILKLAFSRDGKLLASAADDKQIKLWDGSDLSEKRILEPQPDWAPGIVFVRDGKALFAGRLDGTSAYYDTGSGSAIPKPKPELTRLEPRGIERGKPARVHLVGRFLQQAESLKFGSDKLRGELMREGPELWAQISAEATLPRGTYDLSLKGSNGDSAAVKLYVDDIPQFEEKESSTLATLPPVPVSIWGSHQKSGDVDEYLFNAHAGETLVFDAAAKSIGSKADLVLTLREQGGKVLASSNNFDQSPDPLLAYKFEQEGNYVIAVSELLLGGSADHFYRLSVGQFSYVVALFPSIVPSDKPGEVALIGYNLEGGAKVQVPPSKPGELVPALDPEKLRWRGSPKVSVSERAQILEREPNNSPGEAMPLEVPLTVSGRISGERDEDWFRFNAKQGESWVLETVAAQTGSPADTKIEVMDSTGKPVLRVLLQAVRDSAITFRGIDSNTPDCRVENWEEMELNQYLYFQGEVVKLFRAPQGPDSGFLFYTSNGKRRNYFDTSATAHPNAEPCYIVEPKAPGTTLVQNGLPVFPIYFANDDDAERKLGTDSKLFFRAPADGTYLVRLTDTRGFSGERFIYSLNIRKSAPDFQVTLTGENPTVSPGSGQSFNVIAERRDGFDGEIKVEFTGLAPGILISTPLLIQAGHSSASGLVWADSTAMAAGTNKINVVASASINGQTVKREVNALGRISIGSPPPLYVTLEPHDASKAEIVLAPGQTVPARLKVRRNGQDDLVTFSIDDLPHGVIVDNIGLNGVLIPKEQNEREIFITAAKWVPETERFCFAISNEGGRQTSKPVLLKVRKSGAASVAQK